MVLIKKIFYCFMISLCIGLHMVNGQSSSEEPDPLDEFQELEGADTKLKFFVSTPNRYVQSSAYDWLESVKVYLDSAQKIKDSSATYSYRLMQAQLYNDIGDFDKSIALANELYSMTDSLDNKTITLVLKLLDDNYGKLQMFDKKIETRESMQRYGVIEGVNFYDIYASMGLYRKAMNQYILTVGNTIPDNDHLALARKHNTIGYFLFKDKSAATAINEFNKALGYLKIYNNDISKQKSDKEIFQSEGLTAEIQGNIGKSHVLLDENIEAIPFLNESIDILKEFNYREYKDHIIENSLALAEAHLTLDNNKTAKRLLDEDFNDINVAQRIQRNRLLAAYHDKFRNHKISVRYYKRTQQFLDSLKAN